MTAPKKIGVLISGGGSNLQAIIDAAERGEINGCVSVVVSSNAGAYGLERAAKHGIPSAIAALKNFTSREKRDEAVLHTLQSYQVDYVILAGYLGILTEPLIAAYPDRIINIHPALLPKFGGAAFHGLNVHQAVLAAGEKISGATVHFVDGGVDTGPVIAQESLTILPDDTPESLQARILSQIEHRLLVRVVKDLCMEKISVQDGKVVYTRR